MKNDIRENSKSMARLTTKTLQHLKDMGFQYVQVTGFTMDNRPDYMEPRYFMLVPIRELPEDQAKKEVYTPIDSKILMDWANSPDEGIAVMVASVG